MSMPDFCLEIGNDNFRGDFEHMYSIPMHWAIHKESGACLGLFRSVGDHLDLVGSPFTYACLMYKGFAVAFFECKDGKWVVANG